MAEKSPIWILRRRRCVSYRAVWFSVFVAMLFSGFPALSQSSSSQETPDRGKDARPEVGRFVSSPSEEALRLQDPLIYYLEARKAARLNELSRQINPLDLDALGILEDWLRPSGSNVDRDFSVKRIHFMSRFQRKGFLSRFREVYWSAGVPRASSPADTMQTKYLRGLLQSVYGSPSATLLDVPPERRRNEVDQVQFEYYFIVNDAIPVMVMDIEGPFETGLLFGLDYSDLAVFNDVRTAILDRILTASQPDPYNDYFFDPKEEVWYETGYDGREFFTEIIERPGYSWERPQLRIRQ